MFVVILTLVSISHSGVWPVCCHQDGRAEVQQLVSEMRAEGEKHKRELDTTRQQCMREVEEAHRQSLSQCKIQ